MSNSESESTQVIFEETKRAPEIDTTEEQEEEENQSYQLHKEYEWISIETPSICWRQKLL
jgi:hypothetical protein